MWRWQIRKRDERDDGAASGGSRAESEAEGIGHRTDPEVSAFPGGGSSRRYGRPGDSLNEKQMELERCSLSLALQPGRNSLIYPFFFGSAAEKMITFYNLVGDTVAILDVQREVTPSELLASFDAEDCKYGRLVCKCFCEGTQLRRLLRSGWCSLEYRGSPLSVDTAFCNVSTEAEIRLLWQRQECKLGCCINSPQFLDNIFYGEPFPLLEKNIYVSYNDLISPTRFFTQRIRDEITGNTLKASFLHWVTLALDQVAEDSLMRYTGDDTPYLHVEIFVDVDGAKIMSYVYIHRPGSCASMRLQRRHPFLNLFPAREEDLCTTVREQLLDLGEMATRVFKSILTRTC